MPRQLTATVTFDIADAPEGPEEWQVNQNILEQLVSFAATIVNPHVIGEPQVRRLVPTKTKG